MAQKRKLTDVEVDTKFDNEELNRKVDFIFQELRSDFEAMYSELNKELKEKISYNLLREMGMQLFLNATDEPTSERRDSAQAIAQIAYLNFDIGRVIDTMIQKNMRDKWIPVSKPKALKIILDLFSAKKDAIKEMGVKPSSLNENFGMKPAKDKKDVILKKIQEISKSGVESLNLIRKEVINMPLEDLITENLETLPSVNGVEKIEANTSLSGENLSLSVSSVHTSDLSSFNDDIIFSSDEESGVKRKRMSWKVAEEKLAEINDRMSSSAEYNQNQVNITEPKEATNSEDSVNEELSMPKPQRVRKPNSKYNDGILFPLRRTSVGKESKENKPLPQRGRPKKHFG